MSGALHAEWTKLRTVPSTGWTAVAIIVATVAVGSLATASLRPEDVNDLARISLSGVYLGQMAVVVLGVLAVTPEYESTMIRTTLAAHPVRPAVLAAKAANIAAIVLVAGTVSVLGSLVATRMIRPDSVSLVDGSTLRAYAGTVLYLGLIGLLSLGAAMVVRHTGGTITLVLSLLYTMPIVATFVTDPIWRNRILRVAPMTAGLAIQATRDLAAQPIAPWAGIGVLTAWTGAALALGAVLFSRRDA